MPTMAPITFDIDALCAALNRVDGFAGTRPETLEPMPVKGLVHAHIRIRGRGMVLRVPRLSQFGFEPARNLAYQAACFERAFPGGSTPELHAVIPPSRDIPFGALVVEEIVGRAPRLPGDLPVMAECLAAMHILPVPEAAACAPLTLHTDPVVGTIGFIETQAAYLSEAGLASDSARQVEDEIAWARRFAAQAEGSDQPIGLVGTDTHPGNFLIGTAGPNREGRAVFVDLEKALYGSPAIDLAHASVYTSTMWEPDSAAALTRADVEAFYSHYLGCVPEALAGRMRPWLAPLRRLTWLRTTTWCLKWKVEASKPAGEGSGATSLWSADRMDPALIAAVRARVDDYFDPATITRIRAEWLGQDRLEFS